MPENFFFLERLYEIGVSWLVDVPRTAIQTHIHAPYFLLCIYITIALGHKRSDSQHPQHSVTGSSYNLSVTEL